MLHEHNQNSRFFALKIPAFFVLRTDTPEFPAFLCFENLPQPKIQHLVQHKCASATSHLQHCFAFGNPNTVAVWKWNHVSFWCFPCVEATFCLIRGQSLWWGRLWSCWFFPCFVGISAVYGCCLTSPCPFRHSLCAFLHSKNTAF